ncbi:hypothetical protein TGME49_266980 [Toxoplasma gondii ME49]|uniref:Uncharacterized protein n=3 Tax=Toxoplasma gondii TaxID=5811 RepID=A0A2G8Y487_TOXGO|nr:hypothetical protein TGME49_266980 [Toxoplasma gondii ME49]EPT27617.1 hypothetical protein TGME49_266980 [Toxoplasma gondii ME49]KYF45550.1 hypothetical protein TGARI_266980 [Toxoplasma gondii ARI]PIM02072.1 hypothetical protein TGCOUG_266980 [Toxoplasma gondii COUG]|eukprot:XP_018636252.1 hypothetical protein TGME49_266980 [Toxoplasma gondii ME49]
MYIMRVQSEMSKETQREKQSTEPSASFQSVPNLHFTGISKCLTVETLISGQLKGSQLGPVRRPGSRVRLERVRKPEGRMSVAWSTGERRRAARGRTSDDRDATTKRPSRKQVKPFRSPVASKSVLSPSVLQLYHGFPMLPKTHFILPTTGNVRMLEDKHYLDRNFGFWIHRASQTRMPTASGSGQGNSSHQPHDRLQFQGLFFVEVPCDLFTERVAVRGSGELARVNEAMSQTTLAEQATRTSPTSSLPRTVQETVRQQCKCLRTHERHHLGT